MSAQTIVQLNSLGLNAKDFA